MRAWVTAGLTALVLAAPATADARLLEGNPHLEGLRPIAVAAFPAASEYCPHPVRIESRDLSAEKALAIAYADECRIELDDGWRRWGADQLCSTLVHEYGHIARLRFPENAEDPYHDPDPSSIMYAEIHFGTRLPICMRLGPAEQVKLHQARRARRLIARYRRALRPEVRKRLRPKVRAQKRRARRAKDRYLEVLNDAFYKGMTNAVDVPGF